jgi:hypothetical protein
MIAAAPRQLIRNAVESGGKMDATTDKTPSVSLVGVDVVVEYVVSDCKMYCSSVSNPDQMLMTICESEVSRCMLAYDIDFLLSQGRSTLSDVLPDAISRRCDAANMGIRIIGVGVTALHPPANIAEVFEENVSLASGDGDQVCSRHTRLQRVLKRKPPVRKDFSIRLLFASTGRSRVSQRATLLKNCLFPAAEKYREFWPRLRHTDGAENISNREKPRNTAKSVIFTKPQKMYIVMNGISRLLEEALLLRERSCYPKRAGCLYGDRNRSEAAE